MHQNSDTNFQRKYVICVKISQKLELKKYICIPMSEVFQNKSNSHFNCNSNKLILKSKLKLKTCCLISQAIVQVINIYVWLEVAILHNEVPEIHWMQVEPQA